jgi:hypothetical protein
MTKNLYELQIGVVIESEIDDDYDFDDIGELIAADVYEILNNDEDFLEVFYRGAEKYEDF